MNKYKLIKEGSLYRIKALKDIKMPPGIPDIVKGSFGGMVESSKNLSQDGNCWIFYSATVTKNAQVLEDALVYDSAEITNNAIITNQAVVCQHGKVDGSAIVKDSAVVCGHSRISLYATIMEHARIDDFANVTDCSTVCGFATVSDHAFIGGQSFIGKKANIKDNSYIHSSTVYGTVCDTSYIDKGVNICAETEIKGTTFLCGHIIVPRNTEISSCVLSTTCYFNNKKYKFSIPRLSSTKTVLSNITNDIIPINFYKKDAETNENTFFVEYKEMISLENVFLDFCSTEDNIIESNIIKKYDEMSDCIKEAFNNRYKIDKFSNKSISFLYDTLLKSNLEEEAMNFTKSLLEVVKSLKEGFLKNNISNITSFVRKYIFAQLLGIFLYGLDAYDFDRDPNEYFSDTPEKYKDFLTNIINSGSLDLKTKTFSFEKMTFAYNDEILNAIKGIGHISNIEFHQIKEEIKKTEYNSIILYSGN